MNGKKLTTNQSNESKSNNNKKSHFGIIVWYICYLDMIVLYTATIIDDRLFV